MRRLHITILFLLLLPVMARADTMGSEIAANEVVVGSEAPEFTIQNSLDDSTISLQDYDNKVLLLDLMASWCTTCKASTKYLKTAFDTIDNTDYFDILSVSIDLSDTKEKLEEFHQSTNSTWEIGQDSTIAIDGSRTIDEVYNDGNAHVPVFYVIVDGMITWKEVGWYSGSDRETSAVQMYTSITKGVYDLTGENYTIDGIGPDGTGLTAPTESNTENLSSAPLQFFLMGIILVWGVASKRRKIQ